ncbi:hypothetical protein A3Q56_05238 [Intoshia linei]|uniref:Uncharacterized protein n=1 Tax=Intoshia linei TaxID=1819745 RepID=A0A177AYG9_9BILA|nr:hypothetical protein A3Q56_05238 [Intoshia linei]
MSFLNWSIIDISSDEEVFEKDYALSIITSENNKGFKFKGKEKNIESVISVSPENETNPCTIQYENKTNDYFIDFIPSHIGTWKIIIKFTDKVYTYNVVAFDLEKITIRNIPSKCEVNRQISINVDTENCGPLDKLCAFLTLKNNEKIDGTGDQLKVEKCLDHIFKIELKSSHVGRMYLRLFYGNVEITIDKNLVTFYNLSNFIFNSSSNEWSLYDMVELEIDIRHTGLNGTRLIIHEPDGVKNELKGVSNTEKIFYYNYLPEKIGFHYISVMLDEIDVNITKSKYEVKESEINYKNIIKLHHLPERMFVNDKVNFEIAISPNSPAGDLEIVINEGKTRCFVSQISDKFYKCYFVPTVIGNSKIEIQFDGQEVSDNAWKVKVEAIPSFTVSSNELTEEKEKNLDRLSDDSVLGSDLKKFLISVNKESVITIKSDVEVENARFGLIEESGNFLPVSICTINRKKWNISVIDIDVGNYDLVSLNSSKLNGHLICKISTFNEKKMKIKCCGMLPISQVGKAFIDTTKVGEGILDAYIVNADYPGSYLKCNIIESAPRNYILTFVSDSVSSYIIKLVFNSIELHELDSKVTIYNPDDICVNGPGVNNAVVVGQPVEFYIYSEIVENIHVLIEANNADFIPIEIEIVEPGKIKVKYLPNMLGCYLIFIKICDNLVPNTPISVIACEPSKISVYEKPTDVLSGLEVSMCVDTNGAGEGRLEVHIKNLIDGSFLKSSVSKINSTKYRIKFTPINPVSVVLFLNNIASQNCYFDIRVHKLDDILLYNFEPRVVKVDEEICFQIDGIDAPCECFNFSLESNKNDLISIPFEKSLTNSKHLFAKWTPSSIDSYNMNIDLLGYSLLKKQCNLLNVFDPTKCVITSLNNMVMVNQESKYKIDIESAGLGVIEIYTKDIDENPVDSEINKISTYASQISIFPKSTKMHLLYIKFNGHEIIQSPMQINPIDPSLSKVLTEGLNFSSLVGKMNMFKVDTCKIYPADLLVDIRQGHNVIKPEISYDDETQLHIIQYSSKYMGIHEVTVKLSDVLIGNGKFNVEFTSETDIDIIMDSMAIVGTPYTVILDLSRVKKKDLNITCSGENNEHVDFTVDKSNLNLYKILFTPYDIFSHEINIKFDDIEYDGNPISIVPISLHNNMSLVCPKNIDKQFFEEGNDLKKKLQRLSLSEVGIFIKWKEFDIDLDNLKIVILNSSKQELEYKPLQKQDGYICVNFTPLNIGKHSISVLYTGLDINESPGIFYVTDTRKITILGACDSSIHRPIKLKVDTTFCGNGILKFDLFRPNDNILIDTSCITTETIITEDRVITEITCALKKRGIYLLDIYFNNKLTHFSPTNLLITDKTEVIAEGKGLETAIANKENDFTVNYTKSASKKKDILKVVIETVDGVKIQHDTKKDGNSKYIIKYIPKGCLQCLANIYLNDHHVNGSPYVIDVIDPTKVILVNREIMPRHIITNKPFTLTFKTENAGNGKFQIGTNDRLQVQSTFREAGNRPYETCVTYKAVEEGECLINVSYGVVDLKFSPIIFIAHSLVSLMKKILVHTAFTENLVFENEKHEILIDAGNLAVIGTVECYLIHQSNKVPVALRETESNRFVGKIITKNIGKHKIEILWNNTHLPNTPINFDVYCTNAASQIISNADQVKFVITNEKAKIMIDTTRAGPGLLKAHITDNIGVSVPTNIVEIDNVEPRFYSTEYKNSNYKATFITSNIGAHSLHIFYNDVPITNSPFTIYSVSQENANKVKVWGPGLSSCLICNFNGQIDIDTCQAGNGTLSVNVVGPNHTHLVDMDHSRHRHVVARYTPDGIGTYRIFITWSGLQISGSPFIVNILTCNHLPRSSSNAISQDKCNICQPQVLNCDQYKCENKDKTYFEKQKHFKISHPPGNASRTCKSSNLPKNSNVTTKSNTAIDSSESIADIIKEYEIVETKISEMITNDS